MFPGKYESRYGNGAVIELDTDSTLNLTMDMQLRDGYVYPIVMWNNPPVVPPRGQNYLEYRVDYYLQNCACDLPSDHYSDYGTFTLNDKVLFTLSYRDPTLQCLLKVKYYLSLVLIFRVSNF